MPATLPTDNARVSPKVVETVTENQGKIVVTTTISLERDALEASLLTESEALHKSGASAGSVAYGDLNIEQMQQAARDGKITLLKIAPKTYLGFVNGRHIKAHPLCIGDTLFIFVSRHESLTGMAELIAELMRRLPSDASWNGQDGPTQIEQIKHLFDAS